MDQKKTTLQTPVDNVVDDTLPFTSENVTRF